MSTSARRRARNLVGIDGVALVAKDPDQRRRGMPGDLVLWVESPTGRKFLCECSAAPDVWTKTELSA